jgi:hypothetical protein
VVLARLTNSMTGRGKLRPETVQSIAEMALEPPTQHPGHNHHCVNHC